MLRNFISSALNRSLSATSWQGLRISEKLPSLNEFSRPYSVGDHKPKTKLAESFEGVIKDAEKATTFVAKVGFQEQNFPDENTPDLLFDGVPFKQLPIVSCISTKNNTKLSYIDKTGLKLCRTAGVEGYKNAKRGTSVAAYVMSVTFGRISRKLGGTNVRLLVNGFGRGRDAVLKGLKQTGLNIVSVTDTTVIPYRGPRPKKRRRV